MKYSEKNKDSSPYDDYLAEDEYQSRPKRDKCHDRDCYPDDEWDRYPQPPKGSYPKPKFETQTILKCGTSVGSAPIPCFNTGVGPLGGGSGSNDCAAVQASVNLDTSKLIDATVKIDFSSLISFRTSDDDNFFLRLVFKLSKICNCKQIPLGTWSFERLSNEDVLGGGVEPGNCNENEFVQATDSFSFSWCSCDECGDCCQYIVELVDQQCYNIKYATISNISLTALAVGLKEVY